MIGSAFGGVLGGMLLMGLILGGILYIRRRKKRKQQLMEPSDHVASPFDRPLDLDGSAFQQSTPKPSIPTTFNPYSQEEPVTPLYYKEIT